MFHYMSAEKDVSLVCKTVTLYLFTVLNQVFLLFLYIFNAVFSATVSEDAVMKNWFNFSVVDPEWFSQDPAFQVVPDPDPTL